MKIIDAHAHIFPQKIAEKAVESISAFYDIPMDAKGAAEDLIADIKRAGVSKSLVCSVATKPEQVASINLFLAQQAKLYEEFVPFAAMHPYGDIEADFEQIINGGFYGIKLHPDFQQFDIDDERAMEIYRLAEGRLPILFHTGDFRYEWSKPKRLVRVMEKFPDLVCIGAHFGGWSRWEESYEAYKGGKLYMDTSSSLTFIDKEKALKFIEKFGVEKFFFGTDFPMWKHDEELERFTALGLSKEDNEKILAENFERVIIRKEI